MNPTRFRLLSVLLLLPLTVTIPAQEKIIFDTDIGGDADDLAALVMLHAYQHMGQCEILAIMCWATEDFAVPAIDAVNLYYGHPDIPVGVRKQGTYRDPKTYGKAIADKFPFNHTAADVPDATALYRKILSEAEDTTITIVTVGPLYNIKALLESPPDYYSQLPGDDLVEKKAREFVVMGGQFPAGDNEWNFNGNMPGVTKYVLEHLEVPITFSGFEIGVKIKTGAILNERGKKTPLYAGFKYFSEHAPWMKEYYTGEVLDNSSYDQTAVIYAVENGVGKYWNRVSKGRCIADSTGGNTWAEDKYSDQSYLELVADPEEVAARIESLMLFKTEE